MGAGILFANAGILYGAPYRNGFDPTYFSGTNSVASGEAIIVQNTTGPTKILKSEMFIEGTLVATHFYAQGGNTEALSSPLPGVTMSDAVKVVFDSTHFPNGTMIDVVYKVYTDRGNFTDSYQAPVKNKAALFARFDLDIQPLTFYNNAYIEGDNSWKALDVVVAKLTGKNYNIVTKNSLGWDSNDVFSLTEDANVFWVRTHGSDYQRFWTDENDYHFDYPDYPVTPVRSVYPGAVPASDTHGVSFAPHRSAAVGPVPSNYFLPPFNAGSPPFNLAFIDACTSNLYNDWGESLLYPHRNFYWQDGVDLPNGAQNLPANQAVVGYSQGAYINQGRAVNTKFWEALVNGYSVDKARRDAYYVYVGPKPANDRELLMVWGDWYTRIKFVYKETLDSTLYLPWYREDIL